MLYTINFVKFADCMKKKPPLSEADQAAFENAMRGVKPLVQKKLRHTAHTPRPPAIKRRQPHFESPPLRSTADVPSVQSEEFILYQQTSISHKILRNLRKGQYNVEAVLDLHGMTIDAAAVAVAQFLQNALQARMRVVLIIHGKGHHSARPILKNKINAWLRHRPEVLAFCSALPSHGSRGALYVLLKRFTEENQF